MKISEFIGETTEYDKKVTLEERKPKSWLKSVSAFANGIGGALIFGVSDNEEPIGLEDSKKVSEKISEIIKMRMDPIPQIVLEIHAEDGKEFVVLKVMPGQETPYYYAADGIRVAYVRVGNESIPADAVALRHLVLKGSGKNYDSLTSVYKLEDYAFTKLRSVYRIRTGKELEDSDFVSFGLATDNGFLTNGGALLADESPIRHSRLFCTRWYGLDKASGIMEALDDKEFEGSLVSLLQNGEEFVKNNTKKRWKKTGNGRIEMPEFPEQAVLETLVNALIHRDYLETGSEVHIDIFDDRMEIYSPGGMYDGSIVQELDTDHVPSRRRNPVIADVFSRMHYMERRGSGFKKIKADYHNAVNFRPEIEPEFMSTRNAFFVTLYNLNYDVPVAETGLSDRKQDFKPEETGLSDRKQDFGQEKTGLSMDIQDYESLIMGLDLKNVTKENMVKLYKIYGIHSSFARADIMKAIEITASPASELIKKLKDAGFIERVESEGRGKYRFKLLTKE